jgi:probable DNA metabolism protein
MHRIVIEDAYPAWRSAALWAIANGIAPDALEWLTTDETGAVHAPTLFDAADPQAATDFSVGGNGPLPVIHLSKELAATLQDAALFRDPRRWAFLYRVLWRWVQGERAVSSPADHDGARLHRMAKGVRRDKHDMIAYVRFRRQSAAENQPEYVAWYAPEHDILPWAAEHFAQRMGRAKWLITTPHGAALWDGATLHLRQQRALQADHLPAGGDQAEALWLAYYRSTFNPARLNEAALEQHMPVRFWKALPEGALIPSMISEARNGARKLAQAGNVGARNGKPVTVDAAQAQPARSEPTSLNECRRCPLWQDATQAVPGSGPHDAKIMIIGEQPGDHEDLAGRPFIGPAGQLLEQAIIGAGLTRSQLYLTNAVKHFSHTLRGKRRLHKTPAQQMVEACSYWLENELTSVQPEVIVTLGATALGALLHDKPVRLQDFIDRPLSIGGIAVIASYHPAYALRLEDDAERQRVVTAIGEALTQARKTTETGKQV